MRLKLISDLHLEFMKGTGRKFLENLDLEEADVVILAGDLCPLGHLPRTHLDILSDKCQNLVYVLGNHEYYHSTLHQTLTKFNEINERYSNIFTLENKEVEISGVTFAGTSLWFKLDSEAPKYSHQMNDFHAIKLFNQWIGAASHAARYFLETSQADVWITHHLPSWKSVHPKYQGSELNRFFVNNIEDLVSAHSPKYLFHGHTHEQFAYSLGNTEVYCNPLGYPGERKDRDYKPLDLIL